MEQRDNQVEYNTQHGEGSERWPALPYETWRETFQTLHLWTLIVGKVRMAPSPFLNHWCHVTLYVTPRGLTTSVIPSHGGTYDVSFDFIEHTLFICNSEETTKALPLIPRSVAAFYRECMDCLHALEIEVSINPLPSEVCNPIHCDEDEVHASCDPVYIQHFWRILMQIDTVMQRYLAPSLAHAVPPTSSRAASTWPSPCFRDCVHQSVQGPIA